METFCIILESNPLVTQPEDVTQSSSLGVAMNNNICLKEYNNFRNEIVNYIWRII
jgi:hypothetical protein